MQTVNYTIELAQPYPVNDAHRARFHEQGFIKLKDVLGPELLAFYGQAITAEVFRLNQQTKPLAERSTYERAFLQVMNLWTQNETVKEFVFSRRLAQIAADLLGVAGVRLYHDQALYKEPGGGITPWHADQYYWPLSNSNTCTVWIPLQATPLALGPLEFAIGSQHFEENRHLSISDESERIIQGSLKQQNYPLDAGPYDLGEVSYHLGWTFHRAGANTSDRPRAVMTVIYMEDGIRLIEPKTRHHSNDLQSWMPGALVGEIVDTPLNPVLYRA